MKTSNRSTRRQRRRTRATRRAQLLAAFDRSGLSAAALTRQHECRYPTFCGGRARQAQARPAPGFVELELAAPLPARAELVLALGPHARVRITDAGQIALAARRLPALHTPPAAFKLMQLLQHRWKRRNPRSQIAFAKLKEQACANPGPAKQSNSHHGPERAAG